MRLLPYFDFLRALVMSALVLVGLVLVAYACFCERVHNLGQVRNDRKILLVGCVKAVYEANQQNGAYLLEDVTGQAFVGTAVGVPSPGSFILVWGTKRNTPTGRPFVWEE